MQLSSSLTQVVTLVADIYTPVLFLMTLFSSARADRRELRLNMATLIYAAFVVYGWMFIDTYTGLWKLFELDYSTHSAVAFALVFVLGINKSALYRVSLAFSLVVYGSLMYILNYHNWLDMGSTVAVIGLSLLPVYLPNLSFFSNTSKHP